MKTKYKNAHLLHLYLLPVLLLVRSSRSQNDLFVDDVAKSCENFHVYNLDEDGVYTINWSGRKPPNYCKFNFLGKGKGKSYNDKYKVCIQKENYIVIDCDTKIRFYFGTSHVDREYTCSHFPPSYKECGEQDKAFVFHIESTNGYANLNIYPSAFKFNVTAVKTYDAKFDPNEVDPALIIGGVCGGAVFLIITITVCLVLSVKRRKEKSRDLQHEAVDLTTHGNTENSNGSALLSNPDNTPAVPTAPALDDFVTPDLEQRTRHGESNTANLNDNDRLHVPSRTHNRGHNTHHNHDRTHGERTRHRDDRTPRHEHERTPGDGNGRRPRHDHERTHGDRDQRRYGLEQERTPSHIERPSESQFEEPPPSYESVMKLNTGSET